MTQFSTFVLEKCGPSCNQGGCKAKFHCTMYKCVIPHTLIGWEQPSVGEFGQNIDPFLPHDQNPNKSYSTLTLMLVTKRVNKRGCIGCLLWRCFDRNDVMIVQYLFALTVGMQFSKMFHQKWLGWGESKSVDNNFLNTRLWLVVSVKFLSFWHHYRCSLQKIIKGLSFFKLLRRFELAVWQNMKLRKLNKWMRMTRESTIYSFPFAFSPLPLAAFNALP